MKTTHAAARTSSAQTANEATQTDSKRALRGLDFAAQERALSPDASGAPADAGKWDFAELSTNVIAEPKIVSAKSGYGYCMPRVNVGVADMNGSSTQWKPSGHATVGFDLGIGNPAGKQSIASANDPLVTEANWREVQADLTPDATGYAPRTKFYAKGLSLRHERVHLADYVTSANAIIDGKLDAIRAGSAPSKDAASALVRKEMGAIEGDLIESYAGPGLRTNAACLDGVDKDSYMARPGEAHAFSDGKPEYEKLAQEIGARFAPKTPEKTPEKKTDPKKTTPPKK